MQAAERLDLLVDSGIHTCIPRQISLLRASAFLDATRTVSEFDFLEFCTGVAARLCARPTFRVKLQPSCTSELSDMTLLTLQRGQLVLNIPNAGFLAFSELPHTDARSSA